MKCECGNQFEGNFCPACGKPADDRKMSAPVAVIRMLLSR